jgi:hypothetical protein
MEYPDVFSTKKSGKLPSVTTVVIDTPLHCGIRQILVFCHEFFCSVSTVQTLKQALSRRKQL